MKKTIECQSPDGTVAQIMRKEGEVNEMICGLYCMRRGALPFRVKMIIWYGEVRYCSFRDCGKKDENYQVI